MILGWETEELTTLGVHTPWKDGEPGHSDSEMHPRLFAQKTADLALCLHSPAQTMALHLLPSGGGTTWWKRGPRYGGNVKSPQ